MGYLPGIYLQSIVRTQQKYLKAIDKVGEEQEGGRAKTMSDSSGEGRSRANSLKTPAVQSEKGTAWGVEEFQKGGFYS